MEGISLKVASLEEEKELRNEGEEREVGNKVNDNIVFYLCGAMINQRRNKICQECYRSLIGSHSLPTNLDVQQLTICRDEGHLKYCSKNMFELISAVEKCFFTAVKNHKVFVRDSFESLLHEIEEDKLPPVGCESHQIELITD